MTMVQLRGPIQILWSSRFEPEPVQQDCACAGEAGLPEIVWQPACELPDDDCACAGISQASGLVQPLPPAVRLQQVGELYRASLSDEYACYYAPLGSGGVVVLNWMARQILNAFASPATVGEARSSLPRLSSDDVERAVGQLVVLGLLQPEGVEPVLGDGAHTTLSAWLHVTGACNLRCNYCYAPRGGRPMADETGRAALDALFETAVRYGYATVKLKYAGGEPLLNFDLVQRLHLQALQRAGELDLGLDEVVLSNGTLLTDEILGIFCQTGLRLMISLDGTGPGHDAQRPTADHRGTARRVTRNIDRALAHGVSPHVSITLTGEHVDGAAAAVRFAVERNLAFNLNFVREPAALPGVWRVDEVSLIEAARRAFQAIEASLPRHSLVTGLLDRASFAVPHILPCGAGHHYLVIGPSGQVARCQMDLHRPVSDVQACDPLGAVRAARSSFANLPVDWRDGCRTCAWRYACGGGCPRLTRQVAGRDGAASPYCQVYRTLYPELMRLEGQRLLHEMAPA